MKDDGLYSNQALIDCAINLLDCAIRAKPGSWAESVMGLFPPSVFSMDFDGRGGILVNPGSLDSVAGEALFRELRRLGGDRVRIGEWDGPLGGAA